MIRSEHSMKDLEKPVPKLLPMTWDGRAMSRRKCCGKLEYQIRVAQSGRELSRLSRQPGELSRQRRAADAAVPARGSCRRRSRTAMPKSPTSRWPACLHSNVGLMHGLMGIFNAWCDRDADARRSAPRVRSPPRSAVRGSTGFTPPRIRARCCATTRNGTTSRARRRRSSKAC